jgi:hypothetical protein
VTLKAFRNAELTFISKNKLLLAHNQWKDQVNLVEPSGNIT